MRRYTFLLSAIFLCSLGWAAQAEETIQPRIVAPVHEGAEAVFVENLQIGSEVYLSYLDANNVMVPIDGVRTAQGPVRFDTASTAPAYAIKSGRPLVACATYPGSKQTCSDPVSVKPTPTKLMAPPTYAGGTVLYQGAGCVGALPDGLLPGSTVVLRDLTDPSDPTPYEDAVVVQPGQNTAMSIEDNYWPRSQHNLRIVGQLNGQDITPEVSLPLPSRYGHRPGCERKVDPPNFVELPEACRRVLQLDSLAPGGQFGVEVLNGDIIYGPEYCAVTTGGRFLLGLPLKGNSTLEAQQQIKGDSLASCRKEPVIVAAPVLPDFKVQPIATEQDEISIHDLVEGATLAITVIDSADKKKTYPAIVILAQNLAPFTFGLGRNFEPGDKVLITETLGNTPECNLKKEVMVSVAARPSGLKQLEIVTPVYACTSDVEVKNYFDGATVEVRGTGKIISGAGEKDFALGDSKASVISLDYVLEKGWELTATQSFGSQVSNPSTPPVLVEALPNMQAPLKKIRGLGARDLRFSENEYLLDICNPAIHVFDGVRGANIDIVKTERVLPGGARQTAFRHLSQGRLSDPATTAIPVPRKALALGDILTAKQSLCGRGTESVETQLRVGHKVFIEDPNQLQEIDLTRKNYADVKLKLGCKAAEPVTMLVESGNTNVMRVIGPTVTVNPGEDSAMVRVQFLKAGRARLSVRGEYVVAQPSAAGLGRDGLAEVRVFDWVAQQPAVEVTLEIKKLRAGVVTREPFSTAWTGEIGQTDRTLIETFERTRVTKVVNTSSSCILDLKSKLGKEDNRCGAAVSWRENLWPKDLYPALSEFIMDGVPESERSVDREWIACSDTGSGVCAAPNVKLELQYEALTDVEK